MNEVRYLSRSGFRNSLSLTHFNGHEWPNDDSMPYRCSRMDRIGGHSISWNTAMLRPMGRGGCHRCFSWLICGARYSIDTCSRNLLLAWRVFGWCRTQRFCYWIWSYLGLEKSGGKRGQGPHRWMKVFRNVSDNDMLCARSSRHNSRSGWRANCDLSKRPDIKFLPWWNVNHET